jgi:hypothetical protein
LLADALAAAGDAGGAVFVVVVDGASACPAPGSATACGAADMKIEALIDAASVFQPLATPSAPDVTLSWLGPVP